MFMRLVRALCIFPIAVILAAAQCPVVTVFIHGHVENPTRDSIVRVHLVYANEKPGESAETDLQDGSFRIPIDLLTQSSRPLLANLPAKCGRRPKTAVVTLLEGGQESDHVELDFVRDFKRADFGPYDVRTEVVLKNPH